ncbi:MAG TPA: nucleotide sugar dehydrogenase [Gemmataceae bacterium]|nr:nucleotide sugar dehydrogenase [Gemmataceae bacterium]
MHTPLHPPHDGPNQSLPLDAPGEKELEVGPLAIVGGCGHVGLPLALAFAAQGHAVDLLDTSPERVALVNSGRMPFHEDDAEPLLAESIRNGRIKATTDPAVLEDAAAIIVTIGTPVDEYLDPSVGEFDRALTQLLRQVWPGQLLILRSTVFPGMTDRLARQLEQMGRGDVDLAYCPERIVQGKSLIELKQLPQLVAGVTPQAARRAAVLFRIICPKVLFLRPVEAELAKLFCNAWRYINFAIANQFYVMAQHFEADFHTIYRALREDYPRMQSLARPGFAAGPCLLKDTMQLGAFNHGSFVLGQAAMMINEGLPYLVVQDIKRGYPLADMTVGILGMAFKPESDDPRSSLSYKLRKILLLECKRVLCTDPYVPDTGLTPLAEVLDQADLLIVGTPHACYRDLKCRQPIIDITGAIKSVSRDLEGSSGSALPSGSRLNTVDYGRTK